MILQKRTQLTALIDLLDEPDDKAFSVIREKIHAFGKEAISSLEQAWENTFNDVIQQRIEDIIKQIQQENLKHDFLNWIRLGSSDLLQGFLLLSRFHYPELNEEEIRVRIEQLKMDIWLELNEGMTALENVKVINHVLFNIQRFDGNRVNLNALSNQFINTLLETRTGSPLTLGMLYLILAQKLNLPVHGVNLPQHFILAYVTNPELIQPTEYDVLFYINPFNKGAVFTRREIDLFIRQLKIKPDPSFFMPCTTVDIIQRLINNLIFSYSQVQQQEKAEDLRIFLDAIDELETS